MNEHMITFSWPKRILYFIIVSTFVFAVVLFGCSKEKVTEQKGSGTTGPCEILDRLPKDITKFLAVNYGNRIKLVGVIVKKQAQNKLQLSYYWQPIAKLDAYNTVFVHFTDKDNKVLFQNDHLFCQKESQDKFLKETYVVDIPKTATDKEIYVKMGLYDPTPKGLGRLGIKSSGGVPTDEDNTRAIVESLKL